MVHSVYRPQTALPLYAGKRWQRTVLGEGGLRPSSQILALRVYNMPTVSTISRPCLLVVYSVYRPQTALPLYAGKRWQRTVSQICRQCVQSHCIYVCVYTVYCICVCVCVCVCVSISIHTYIHTYIHIYTYICRTTLYDTVRRVVLCRTVSYQRRTTLYDASYCVVLCRTVSYCVVLCRTVSYSVVLCRTVSYCVVPAPYDTVQRVVQCRTASYSVVQCRTSVVRHCTTRRTVSYKVSGPDASGMYDVSYSVVQGVGARRVGDV